MHAHLSMDVYWNYKLIYDNDHFTIIILIKEYSIDILDSLILRCWGKVRSVYLMFRKLTLYYVKKRGMVDILDLPSKFKVKFYLLLQYTSDRS